MLLRPPLVNRLFPVSKHFKSHAGRQAVIIHYFIMRMRGYTQSVFIKTKKNNIKIGKLLFTNTFGNGLAYRYSSQTEGNDQLAMA